MNPKLHKLTGDDQAHQLSWMANVLHTLQPRTIKSVACSNHGAIVLLTNGSVYTWRQGTGASPQRLAFTSHDNQALDDTIFHIAAGDNHFAALSDKYHWNLYVWGGNESGQLGLGDREDRARPTIVDALTGRVADVACGARCTLCVLDSNEVYAWGEVATHQSQTLPQHQVSRDASLRTANTSARPTDPLNSTTKVSPVSTAPVLVSLLDIENCNDPERTVEAGTVKMLPLAAASSMVASTDNEGHLLQNDSLQLHRRFRLATGGKHIAAWTSSWTREQVDNIPFVKRKEQSRLQQVISQRATQLQCLDKTHRRLLRQWSGKHGVQSLVDQPHIRGHGFPDGCAAAAEFTTTMDPVTGTGTLAHDPIMHKLNSRIANLSVLSVAQQRRFDDQKRNLTATYTTLAQDMRDMQEVADQNVAIRDELANLTSERDRVDAKYRQLLQGARTGLSGHHIDESTSAIHHLRELNKQIDAKQVLRSENLNRLGEISEKVTLGTAECARQEASILSEQVEVKKLANSLLLFTRYRFRHQVQLQKRHDADRAELLRQAVELASTIMENHILPADIRHLMHQRFGDPVPQLLRLSTNMLTSCKALVEGEFETLRNEYAHLEQVESVPALGGHPRTGDGDDELASRVVFAADGTDAEASAGLARLSVDANDHTMFLTRILLNKRKGEVVSVESIDIDLDTCAGPNAEVNDDQWGSPADWEEDSSVTSSSTSSWGDAMAPSDVWVVGSDEKSYPNDGEFSAGCSDPGAGFDVATIARRGGNPLLFQELFAVVYTDKHGAPHQLVGHGLGKPVQIPFNSQRHRARLKLAPGCSFKVDHTEHDRAFCWAGVYLPSNLAKLRVYGTILPHTGLDTNAWSYVFQCPEHAVPTGVPRSAFLRNVSRFDKTPLGGRSPFLSLNLDTICRRFVRLLQESCETRIRTNTVLKVVENPEELVEEDRKA